MPSVAVTLATLQLAFALTWVIYVIYLPALAVQAGMPKGAVPWILLLDQAIFIACDWLAGVHADRVARSVGRIGPRMAMVTVASAAAFLALPFVAPAGSPVLFILLTVLWSATSSALRAPPLTLAGRHAASPARAWIAGVSMLGLGIAGALAPYLGVKLRNVDPRIPFVIATVAVVAMTFALAAAERRFVAPATQAPPHPQAPAGAARLVPFALAMALYALGFQLYFAVNAAPGYLRFAKPAELEHLMPVFWIGFNLLVLPATLVTRRLGGVPVMTAAGVVGALAAMATPQAASLETLAALQFATGAAWSAILTSAFTAALEAGRTGREGSASGLLFSMLAVAAFARIAFVAGDVTKLPQIATLLPAAPAIAWAAATFVLAALVLAKRGAARPL